MSPAIQMVDVVRQYQKIKPEIDAAIQRVLESGHYILGSEAVAFEKEVAAYLGVRYAVGVASGTDALQIALMALEIGPGDEVITSPFTFVATVETIALLGAKPVYVDIDPATFNIDSTQVARVLTSRTKAIIPVHLYGHAADMDPLVAIANEGGIPIIEDAAQAIGAEYRGKMVGGIGAIGCISFYPSKNLGAFGDGGLIVTNDETLSEAMRVIANHGSRVRYRHEVLGVNSRLDALQAAVLRVKLRHLDAWNEERRHAARRYDALLAEVQAGLPVEKDYAKHVYHQYTIRVRHRDEVAQQLQQRKIPHAIYYPIPLHRQEAFRDAAHDAASFPATEAAAREVLSLPMHTELTEEQQSVIVNALKESIATTP